MAKIIDATLKLIDQFSPTLRQVDKAIGSSKSAMAAATTAAKNAGASMKSYSKNMEENEKIHQRVAKSIQNTGKELSSVGKSMAFISVPLLGAAAAGWTLSQSLDKAVNRVGMLGQLSATETAQIKKDIVELSNNTNVAAETIAEATQKAIAGGISAGDSMKYMNECIKYSKVSGMELNEVTANTIAYTKAYNLTLADVASLNDQQIKTAQLAHVEMAQMSPALAGVAKSAADAGVSVQQMDAAYVMMVRRGTDSGQAASSLSGLFDSFSKASPKAIKAAQEFGIEMNQAHIKAIGFPAFLQEIQDKTGGDEQAIGKIIKDVGAFKLAMKMASGDGATEFANVLDQINKSGGATGDALGHLKSPAVETAKAMNQIKNAGVELVEGLAPLWTSTATSIKAMVGAFNSLDDGQKQMIFSALRFIIVMTMVSASAGKAVSMFGGLFGSVTTAAAAISKAGGLVPLLAGKLGGLVSSLKLVGTAARLLFANPIGIAIMAVIGLAYLLYTYWGPISGFFKGLWDGIVNNVTWAVNAIKNLLTGIGNAISAARSAISAVISWIIGFVAGGISSMVAICQGIFGIWLSNVQIIATGIMTIFGGVIDFVAGVFTGNWSQAWQGVVEIFTGIFFTIEGVCNNVMQGIKAAINTVISGINGVSVDIPDWVPGVGGQHYAPNIPMLANGTDNWRGGPAMIHDAGPEIVDLPSGSRVIPHNKSMREEYQRGKADTVKDGISLTIAKLADTIFVREDADIDKIATAIAQKLEAHAMNQAIGAV
jgi:phage tail tape measure protein, TP901 family, core region